MAKKKSKAFVELLHNLKKGDIKNSYSKLTKFEREYLPEVSFVRACISAFYENYENAYKECEVVLRYPLNWYIANILDETLCLYSFIALKYKKEKAAIKYLNQMLALVKKENKDPIANEQLKNYFNVGFKYLKKERTNFGYYLFNCNKNNPSVAAKSKKGWLERRPDLYEDKYGLADYISYDIMEYGNLKELQDHYSKNKDILSYDRLVDMVRIFVKNKEYDLAQEILMQATKKMFKPTAEQILPIEFIYDENINPILTKELKEDILYMKKRY